MLTRKNKLSLIKLVSIIMTSVISITSLAQNKIKSQTLSTQNPDTKRQLHLEILSSPSAARLEKLKALDEIRQYQIAIKSEGGVDGGNFAYQYTSDLYFKYFKKFLSSAIQGASVDFLNQFLNEFKKEFPTYKNLKINWQDFANVIDNIYPLRNIDMIQIDNLGEPRPLLLTYDQSKNQVYALREWFKKYDQRKLEIDDSLETKASLLHEVSHIFGIGINKDDSVSRFFSIKLAELVHNTYGYRCVRKYMGHLLNDNLYCPEVLPLPDKKVDLSTLYFKLKTLDDSGQEITKIVSKSEENYKNYSAALFFYNKKDTDMHQDDPQNGGLINIKKEDDLYRMDNYFKPSFSDKRYPLGYAQATSGIENPVRLSIEIDFTRSQSSFGKRTFFPQKRQPLILEIYDKTGLILRVENFKDYNEQSLGEFTDVSTYRYSFWLTRDRISLDDAYYNKSLLIHY